MDSSPSHFSLPPYRFDAATDTLWHGTRARRLRPRAGALLRFLLERPGQVVSADDVLAALWPGVQVGPGVVKVYVWEIRQALRDPQRRPRFLATVPGRGYRWIGAVAALAPGASGGTAAHVPLVGRDAELGELRQRLARAEQGERQLVLVRGEPGIGKSALVAEFLRGAPGRATAPGQCIEQTGPGEAYLPVLSALGALARGPRRRQLVRALARHAPTWLVQLPDALESAEAGAVRRAAEGATRERMLRELAEALEHLTARSTLVLVLEDLQWSDASTLDLLALLARRTRRARLLVIATLRPADVAPGDHPLRSLVRELGLHGRCSELALGFLGAGDVAAYLEARLGAPAGGTAGALDALARAIHQRTEGNPLFMVNVVDDLLAGEDERAASARALAADAVARVMTSIPARLDQAIEARIARLGDDDQRLLEAASAAGAEVSAAALAAACELPVEEVERRCAGIARGAQLLEARGEEKWPDGTVAGRFGFVHALYQSVLYRRLTPARRRTLHRRLAERLESGWGARAAEIAPVLAAHREHAGDPAGAIAHLETAAQNALGKHANAEAARHLAHAIELLRDAPDGPERAQRELALQVRLGAPLLMARGYAAPEVRAAYGRALELCRVVGESPQQLLALAGIYRFVLMRSELHTAHALGDQVLGFARRSELPLAFQIGHLMLGITSFGLGELAAARSHLAAALELHDVALRPLLASSFGDDPAVVCLSHAAMTSWFLGEPDRALERSAQALACARETGLPHGLVFALTYACWCRLLRREGALARAHVEQLLTVAAAGDFPYWLAQGTAIRGWVLIDEGRVEDGIAEIRRGLAAYEALGAEVMRPWHLVRLAEACAALGRTGDGRAALAEAFATMRLRDERFYEAELHRVDGELQLADGDEGAAEASLREALRTARRQGALSLELRAASSLARLQRHRGRPDDARQALAPVLERFREGFATGDVRDARALLAELA